MRIEVIHNILLYKNGMYIFNRFTWHNKIFGKIIMNELFYFSLNELF